MGSIIPRRRSDGTTAYMAQISIMRELRIVYRESRTFDREPAARAWMQRREAELRRDGGIEAALAKRAAGQTLADAIDRYIAESERQIGRTKAQVLRTIKAADIGGMDCERIGSQEIVALARELIDGGVSPQTAANYLSHLASVFRIARPAWGIPLDAQAMADAMIVTRKLGLTSKSRERSRRPALEEIDRLMSHFARIEANRPGSTPMVRIVAFALFSTRRLEEITRLEWSDLDEPGARIMVRDMKHPGDKAGNDTLVDLPAEAIRIIRAMPRSGPRIFPYSTDAIGAAFTRATRALAIEDLHFHDLRHEGVSRLFEIGLTIPRVAAVSGHRSWVSLKRYTHIRQTGDRWAGWQWLDRVASLE